MSFNFMVVSAVYVSDDPFFQKSFLTSAITVTLCSLWPTLINTALGVSAIDRDLTNVGRVLQLNIRTKITKIILPSSLPLIFTGLRLSLGVGWMVLIAAEMLAQNPGLGKFVWDEFQNGSSNSLAKIMHWTDQFASAARADSLVPSRRDPLSGQPALKCARVSLKKFPAKTYGYAITRQKPDDLHSAYWAQSKIPGGWQVELAWDRQQENWETEARKLLSLPPDTELLTYLDRLTGSVRYAAFEGDRLFALFCAGKAPVSVSRS